MSNEGIDHVWVFNGAGGRLPSAIFLDKQMAIAWIAQHRLTGVLTRYPVNIGLYDWALRMNFFTPRREDQKTPQFIGRFTCASLEHYHCEDGVVVTGW